MRTESISRCDVRTRHPATRIPHSLTIDSHRPPARAKHDASAHFALHSSRCASYSPHARPHARTYNTGVRGVHPPPALLLLRRARPRDRRHQQPHARRPRRVDRTSERPPDPRTLRASLPRAGSHSRRRRPRRGHRNAQTPPQLRTPRDPPSRRSTHPPALAALILRHRPRQQTGRCLSSRATRDHSSADERDSTATRCSDAV